MPAPPNLQERMEGLRRAARELPDVAARELEVLTKQSHQQQRAPDGTTFEPVKPYGGNRTGTFDPLNSIRYHAVVRGEQVMLEISHHAAKYQRYGTLTIPPRPLVPRGGDDLGWWLPVLLGAFRGTIEGAVR